MMALREYREKFPAWQDADEFRFVVSGGCVWGRESREDYEARSPATTFITGVWKCFSINRNDVYVV